jgi:predicted nucleic acid-binding protein
VPSDVFTETVNTLNKIASHQLAVDACAFLRQTPPFLVTESSSEIHRDAVARFQKHGTGAFSLTDWIVLAFAEAFATRELFAFDEGMARQGFAILRKEVATA